MNFSSLHRTTFINQLQQQQFDVLVIGGGITGAGIALDAVSRGLTVALIDMQDFSAGTSSRSTKLIHGGLRYLKQLDFKLVAEVGKERKIIHAIAPHLTRPEPMLLPIIKNGSLGKLSARFGMWLYEWLAGVKKEEWHKVLNVNETLNKEPLLTKENLLAGILFYEYRTDDARLTIEVLKEAVNKGVVAINYLKATDFIYNNGKINGAQVHNQLTNESFEIKAKYIVNACGPWVDELDSIDKKQEEHKLKLTKGVHFVVDWKKLPVKQSLYFDTFDKRMLFIIPRDGKTYLGTTDTFYSAEKVNPTITNQDRTYLLKCINDFFPNNTLQVSDLESAWVGLRPLISKPGKGPSEISRKDELFETSSGLLTIAGGKLTGYRKMAQRIVDKIATKIKESDNKTLTECVTQHIHLAGGQIPVGKEFANFVSAQVNNGLALGLTDVESKTLIHRYGANVSIIYNLIEQLKTEASVLPIFIRAQLHYAINYEMCMSISDFVIRRTGMLYFDIDSVKKWKTEIEIYMQQLLALDSTVQNWFTTDLNNQLTSLEKLKIATDLETE